MRRLVVRMLALAAVLTGVGVGFGQQAEAPPKRKVIRVEEEKEAPKAKAAPTKSKLEEMLAEALKNNPDIRVAAARVAKADAELNRTRLQVTQKVVELYYAIDTQKKTVTLQEQKMAVAERSHQSARIGFTELLDARGAVTLAKAKLAELEAQMPPLLGKVARAGEAKDTNVSDLMKATSITDTDFLKRARVKAILLDAHQATGPMADKIRKALETPITVNYKEVELADVLKDLEKKAPGLSFQNRYSLDRSRPLYSGLVALTLDKPMPVDAVLQAIEDRFLFPSKRKDEDLCFIVRQYGILAVSRGELPPGAITVQEFMRQKPTEK